MTLHEGRSRPFHRAPTLEEHVAFSMAVLRPAYPVTRIGGPIKHTFVIAGEMELVLNNKIFVLRAGDTAPGPCRIAMLSDVIR